MVQKNSLIKSLIKISNYQKNNCRDRKGGGDKIIRNAVKMQAVMGLTSVELGLYNDCKVRPNRTALRSRNLVDSVSAEGFFLLLYKNYVNTLLTPRVGGL